MGKVEYNYVILHLSLLVFVLRISIVEGLGDNLRDSFTTSPLFDLNSNNNNLFFLIKRLHHFTMREKYYCTLCIAGIYFISKSSLCTLSTYKKSDNSIHIHFN